MIKMLDFSFIAQNRPTSKELRNFGILFSIISIAVSFWYSFINNWQFGLNTILLLLIGFVLLLVSFIKPRILEKPYTVWMTIAHMLGFVMTSLILTLTFFVAFLPIKVGLLLFGKDPMERKWDNKKKSYWQSTETPMNKEHFERLF